MSYGLKNVAIRLVEEPPLLSETKITSPEAAIKLVGNELKKYSKEVVCIISVDARQKPLNMSIVSMGALNECFLDPKEVFKPALLSNAFAIILLHNHPAGDLTPSRADISMTDRLVKCGKLLELPLQDHIIVGNPKTEGYYSLNANQLISDTRQEQRVEYTVNVEELQFDMPMVAEPTAVRRGRGR